MVWAAIGAAAIGVVGGYVNSQQQAKAMKGSSGSSGYDPNIQAGTNQAVQTAQDVANQPWTGIDMNQAVAGLTPNQITAQQEAGALGEQLPGLDATATQAFNQGNLQKYMNPYEADVLDVQKQFATREFLQQQTGRDSKKVLTSAFGGDRNAISDNEALNSYNLNLQGIQASGLKNAFDSGMGAFNQDRNYAAGEGAAIRGALSSTGATAQSTAQTQGNFRNSQFNEQRDWSKNQNAYLAQILGQVPKGSFYTGQQSAYTKPAGGGWGGAIAGAAQIGLAGLSAYQSQPANPNNSGDMSNGSYNGGAFGGGAPYGGPETGYTGSQGMDPTGGSPSAFDFSGMLSPQSVPVGG